MGCLSLLLGNEKTETYDGTYHREQDSSGNSTGKTNVGCGGLQMTLNKETRKDRRFRTYAKDMQKVSLKLVSGKLIFSKVYPCGKEK